MRVSTLLALALSFACAPQPARTPSPTTPPDLGVEAKADAGPPGDDAAVTDSSPRPDGGLPEDAAVVEQDAGSPASCQAVSAPSDGIATNLSCTVTAECPGLRQICRAGLCYEQIVHPGARPGRAVPPLVAGDALPLDRWPDPSEEWRICSFRDSPRMLYPTRDACGVCPRDLFSGGAGGNDGNFADVCVGDVVTVAHYDNNRRSRGFDLGTYEVVAIAECGASPVQFFQAKVRRGADEFMVDFDALTMLGVGDTASRRRVSWLDTSSPVEKRHDLFVVGDVVPLFRQNVDRAVVDLVTITSVDAEGWPASFTGPNPATTITYLRGVQSTRMCTLFEPYCVGDPIDRVGDYGRTRGVRIRGVIIGGRPDVVVGKLELESVLVRCDANATTGCLPADDGHYYAEVEFAL